MKWIKRVFFIALLSGNVLAQTPAPADNPPKDPSSILVEADKPTFYLKLKSNPTTGYSWFLKEYDSNLISVLKHQYFPPKNKKLMGAPGYELWTFRVKYLGFVVPRELILKFDYLRPWEGPTSTSESIYHVMTNERSVKK